MVLFRVVSHIQLISALLLRMQIVEDDADIHLLDGTDFSNIADRLRESGLFRRVIQCEDYTITKNLYNCEKKEVRLEMIRKVPNFWGVELDCKYDTYFMGHDAFLNKMFYYYLLKHQEAPDVYVLEDGLASYAHDIYDYAMSDDIDHVGFRENNLLKHICGQYLYQPNLYLGQKKFDILNFPQMSDRTRQMLRFIYGEPKLPQEQIIVFTACFPETRVTANELQLVRMIEHEVGKENIIIKTHPRAIYNPYAIRGYKIMEQSDIPWEIFLLDTEFEHKVLISATSYAVFTRYGMFKQPQPVVFLSKQLKGNFPMVNDTSFKRFINALTIEYNKEFPQVFCPADAEGFSEAMKYIKGRWLT